MCEASSSIHTIGTCAMHADHLLMNVAGGSKNEKNNWEIKEMLICFTQNNSLNDRRGTLPY